MDRNKRINLIKQIQQKRKSTLFVYITGDRKGLETRIAEDVFPMLHKHLTQANNLKRIDLFLYSPGGTTISGYALVNLFREFCDEFNVIIPFKALSCATLVALGANEIVMTKMSQLSPIDPSVDHPLSPLVQIPGQPVSMVPVSVEDVNAFIEFAKKAGLKNENSIVEVFKILASKVNPLVLGAVEKSREQIAFLAEILMGYHISNKEQIKKTIEILTRKRFTHGYRISRREAKEIVKLKVVEPNKELTNLIVDLYNGYNDILMMDKPYNHEEVLGTNNEIEAVFNRAIIESIDLTHIFRTRKELKRVEVVKPGISQPEIRYQERILQEEWIEDNSI